MIKVLYDISLAGVAHRYIGAKTGIFRVATELAEALAASGECELSFCAGGFAEHFRDTLRSREWNDWLPEVKRCISLQTKILLHSEQKFDQYNNLIQSIHKNNALTLSGLRVVRRIYHEVRRAVEARQRVLITSRDLSKSQICHSPFLTVPDFHNQKSVKKFVTIYDLIPHLFPEYFKDTGIVKLWSDDIKKIDESYFILSISECTKRDLCNAFPRIQPEKVFVTPLAASESFYPSRNTELAQRIKAKYGLPHDSRYILSLATLEPRKNTIATIKAFLQLMVGSRRDDLFLVLSGNKGWDFDQIFETIQGAPQKYKSKIICTGFVPDEDLAPLYSNAEVFIYPSFYEGFGLPPLEAMKCGIPVVTSNTSSLPEVVGNAGLMLDPNNLDGLSNAIASILDEPRFAADLRERSLKQASRFSWAKCAEETIKAYKTALQIN